MQVGQDTQRVVIRLPDGDLEPLAALAEDVLAGLTSTPPVIPSKYHYDARGSELFEEITRLPEYYQTRTEQRILEAISDELIAELEPCALIEFGSGSARKTRTLLDAMMDRGCLEGVRRDRGVGVGASHVGGNPWRPVPRLVYRGGRRRLPGCRSETAVRRSGSSHRLSRLDDREPDAR